MTYSPIQPQQNPTEWVPDGMPEFKVGMRVQVNLRGECERACSLCGHLSRHLSTEGNGTVLQNSFAFTQCQDCNQRLPMNISQQEGHGLVIALDNGPITMFAASELVLLAPDKEGG